MIAAALAAALAVLRSSRTRYAAACLALSAFVIAFVGTLIEFARTQTITASRHSAPFRWVAAPDATLPARGSTIHLADVFPWLAPFWIAGVVFFAVRHFAGWAAARKMRRTGVCSVSERWQDKLAELSRRMRVSRHVVMLESALAAVPVVIGHLRPVILVPAGLLAGLPAAQLETILLHELAHIRRCDYLINHLQVLAESLLFYHPLAWWISRVVRAERENCCDDLAVAAVGDAYEYASALAALEQSRHQGRELAPAATGGNLVQRIHRLLVPSRSPRPVRALLPAAALMLVVAGGALMAWQTRTPSPSTLTPYQRWLEEEVVYIISPEESAAFQLLQTDDERKKFIEQFWLRRDPTPGTPANEYMEEHYRRIAYANDRFSTQAVAGWRTDRGHMYISFGPPDEFEAHPAGDAASPYPSEKWMYRYLQGAGTNVIIEFVDRTGTGDFPMTMDPNRAFK